MSNRWTNETRWTPPRWARFLFSWRLLGWIDAHFDTCWANMVLWKLGHDEDNWWPSRMCFRGGDYCGKFDGKPLPDFPDSPIIIFCGRAEAPEKESHD